MKKTILLAVLFALLAAFFAYSYLSDLETKYRTMAEPVKVIIANQRIPQGTTIEKYMLSEKLVPKEYIQPKAFGSISDFFTKEGAAAYISLNTFESGEQLTSTKVSLTNSDTGISNIIPDGCKALAVNFDSDSSSVITPGSRIDVLCIIEYADTNSKFQQSVYVISQNILVLAVGNNYLGSAKKDSDDYDRSSSVVTLSVTVEEAQIIMLASDSGSLKYIIRPAGDNEIYDIKPLKVSDIVKDISKSVPQKTAVQKAGASQSQKEVLEIISKYANSQNR